MLASETTAPLTLLEFISCCFDKNEMINGLHRWNVYETSLQAEQQVDALVREGVALLGNPRRDTLIEGVRSCQWPTLRIMHKGLAVLVVVPVRFTDAYCCWDKEAATWERAQPDLSALFSAA